VVGVWRGVITSLLSNAAITPSLSRTFVRSLARSIDPSIQQHPSISHLSSIYSALARSLAFSRWHINRGQGRDGDGEHRVDGTGRGEERREEDWGRTFEGLGAEVRRLCVCTSLSPSPPLSLSLTLTDTQSLTVSHSLSQSLRVSQNLYFVYFICLCAESISPSPSYHSSSLSLTHSLTN
jgi:hypothetical protein